MFINHNVRKVENINYIVKQCVYTFVISVYKKLM